MDSRILLNVFTLCCVYSVAETKRAIDDYCWRDFDGIVPPDAFVAGESAENYDPVYIGQALFGDKIIPGKIFNNINKIYYEFFSKELTSEHGGKILCTQNPYKFEWISTRHTEVRKIRDKVFVKGGLEPKCDTYLGRTKTAEGLIPGKVMCCEGAIDECFGLYTTFNGNGTQHWEFEILAYNENIPDIVAPVIPATTPKTTRKNCKKISINFFI